MEDKEDNLMVKVEEATSAVARRVYENCLREHCRLMEDQRMILQSLKAKYVMPVNVTIPTDEAEVGNLSISNSTITTTPSSVHR
jgi:hypothetical protein